MASIGGGVKETMTSRSLDKSEITKLSALNESSVDAAIMVRIIKLWKLPSFKNPNATHAVELILMDEEGTKIQATVMNTYLCKHERFLVEKECVYIKKFAMGDNISSYRLTSHPHKLFLNFESVVKRCDPVGTLYGFSFIDFELLRNNSLTNNSVVDIIGYVYTYFDMYDHETKNGQMKKKMNLQVRDSESRTVFVTLWESYAEKMSDFFTQNPDGVTAIMILQLGRSTFSNGRAYVSSSFQGSSLYINEAIDEIESFKKSIGEIPARRLEAARYNNNVEDEFLRQNVFNTIDQVNKSTEVKSVVLMGTVITFSPGLEWYYNACTTCNKKVITQLVTNDETYGVEAKQVIECPSVTCKNKMINTVPRFKVPLRVQDCTGIVDLTMLDREASKLLKKSAREIIDKAVEDDTLSMVPLEMNELVGKKIAFKIDIEKFNINNKYKAFTVNKFTEDASIISKLEAKFDVDQGEPSQSFNNISVASESQDTVNFKDTMTCVSDNETPLSRIGSTKGKGLLDEEDVALTKARSDLKRNLVEVYDLDETPSESATKHCHKTTEDSNTAFYNINTRKQRNLYLDSTTSKDPFFKRTVDVTPTIPSVTMNDSYNHMSLTDGKQRRKMRKNYLDTKRNNDGFIAQNLQVTPAPLFGHQHNLQPSNGSRHLSNCNENDTTNKSYPYSDASSLALYTNQGIRTPLSDITKDMNIAMVNTVSRQRRLLRKTYLDKKRMKAVSVAQTNHLSSSNTSMPVSENSNAPHTTLQSANRSRSVLNIKQSNTKKKSSISSNTTSRVICTNESIKSPLSHSPRGTLDYTDNEPTSSSNFRRTSVMSNDGISTPSYITSTNNCNVQNKDINYSSSKQRRLYRKNYLDARKSNVLSVREAHGSKNTITGVSKDYLDHGDQNVICELCHAKLWKHEAARGKSTDCYYTSYSMCCGYGKVQLPDVKEPPREYKNLFNGSDSESKFFLKNIRRYNSMFSFTSMGGKVDSSINRGNAPFIFRLSGQNYHQMGSLLPRDGSKPKFSQLYIYDTENEISNRQSVFSDTNKASTSASRDIDLQLIQYLKNMLDSNNVLVQTYRMVRDCFKENPHLDLKLRLIGKRQKDGRTYNLPTASEVAALIVGDIGDSSENRDIVVKTKEGSLKYISELHPSYLALQYPLICIYGEDCYRVDIPHRAVGSSTSTKRKTCTMREYFAYIIQDRMGVFSLPLNSRRLFQQLLVDVYTMIETERLNYIRFQQKELRCESFENLRNLRNHGTTDVSNVGKRVILPSSFTGGARYMMQNYLDAMSICKWYGYPDLFLTFTCNPKWPEVKRFLKDTNVNLEDRPDILCRLFKIKLDSLIKDLKESSLLGRVLAVVYTVEFQKRGLPHAHICLFLHPDHKFPTVEHVDPIICAEIPDKNKDMEMYTLVSDFMMHGPCGGDNINCPCMVDKRCSKNFPKPFRDRTSIDSAGFPLYRRRDNGFFVEKSNVKLDNRSVVPYNKKLLKRYQAHINVEWCNQTDSIKYLFKYINKGPDRVTVSVTEGNAEDAQQPPVDEIKNYYDCRYLSACEASWRIFSYDVHYRYPSVMRLPFHLPNQQQVTYMPKNHIDNVLNKPSVACTQFLAWMECNKTYEDARNLTYVEFPTKFVWKQEEWCWAPRKSGFSIGRIHSIYPSAGEGYFLRILLNKVKGPKSFDDILTVNGHKYDTFRQACYALGLLDDDTEFVEAIQEASHAGSGNYLRRLFTMMLMSDTLSRPEFVWEKTWEILSDGILYKQQRILKVPELQLDEDQLKNLTLYEIEKLLNCNNYSLRNWKTMPYPDHDSISSSNNRLITEEMDYDRNILQNEFANLLTALNDEQRCVYNEIINAVEDNKGGVFFVYGYGGTGKTFLWKTLSTSLRSTGKIVLNVASSGIASLLLTGGRTAHSRFSIPFNLTEVSTCNIKLHSDVAHLLKKTSLIIWDEAPMIHRHGFEALDRTLRDILSRDDSNNANLPFGGKAIVFGGDFRQVLPVIQSGTRQDIVNASLSSSYIWNYCKVLRLTKNMRLTVGSELHDIEKTKKFAQWLLDLGEGNIGGSNDGDAIIEIPEDLLIMDSVDPISDLIEFVYPSILQNFKNTHYFQEKAILAPTNEVVDEINDRLLSMFPGDNKEYLSSDSICPEENVRDDLDPSLYSPDMLNGLKISGLPHHKLVLKVGVPVMLLRNIDQKRGLCNGTRLKVISLGSRVIEVEVITGSNLGMRTWLHRVSLTPSDKKIPFKFQRRQFPITLCFAMTINKSQGQSLSRVGLFFKQPVFSHGQLYVALSRVKSRDGIKLVILDKDGNLTNKTSNVVYKEVFRDL